MTDNITLPRSVLEQALEAFEDHAKQYPHMVKGYTLDAAEALRAALEQPHSVDTQPKASVTAIKEKEVVIQINTYSFDGTLKKVSDNMKQMSDDEFRAKLDLVKAHPLAKVYYEPDDGPLTDEQIESIRNMVPKFKDESFTETLFIIDELPFYKPEE